MPKNILADKFERPQGPDGKPPAAWRARTHEIIFEADTATGKLFDVVLIGMIIASIIVVMLDSVAEIHDQYGSILYFFEWLFTLLFTIEYALRIACLRRPAKYIKSFYGIVDLIAILPTYLSLLLPGSQYLMVVRTFRLLRVFRILKLAQYLNEAEFLLKAIRTSSRKIAVFLFVVLTMVLVFGSLLYMIEGDQNGFTSIGISCYWAITTLTTVGYGDLSPQTPLGRAVASVIMIMGYGVIAVPTGIVTAELVAPITGKVSTQACPDCGSGKHSYDAVYCKFCGASLHAEDSSAT
ncbi:MAG: ion transporter [Deltaproteobacteria bacterium]|jgi:voltage-gated potassium channel|nr:ion transporter [Deltaproteobacteria bacterium]MBW2504925.1 ion transporter [Deltaproteobacteria bacterium]MBW2519910.1 ion transporter [Deltaproteobacteria bacterium]